MQYHVRTVALCVTIGLVGYFIGSSVVGARGTSPIDGEGIAGRIPRFEDSNTIFASGIRDNGSGNIGIGGNPKNVAQLLVTGVSAAVNAEPGLAPLIAAKSGSAPGNSPVLQVLSDPSPTAELMRVQRDGNVGIGTSTPDTQLAVAGVVHSTEGGFMFPDGSVQTTASTPAGMLPAPAFDSGFIDLLVGQELVLPHTVGGDPETYLVDFQTRTTGNIGNRGIGGSDAGRGAFYDFLTSSSVRITRGDADNFTSAVRVRIWRTDG